jgi:hypothetical protein
LAPPQKFRISDPFGKSRQQGGVDIKWNGPIAYNGSLLDKKDDNFNYFKEPDWQGYALRI